MSRYLELEDQNGESFLRNERISTIVQVCSLITYFVISSFADFEQRGIVFFENFTCSRDKKLNDTQTSFFAYIHHLSVPRMLIG
ncbi:hypothetical protein LINPERHAP1_LOCUS22924 [Linum perenne]